MNKRKYMGDEEVEELTVTDDTQPLVIEQGSFISRHSLKTIITLCAIIALLVVVAVLFIVLFYTDSKSSDSSSSTPKNLIFMISDGFGPTSVTFARILSGGSPNTPILPLDSLLKGIVHTSSYSSLITDSAAGATAYSCGLKTNNRWVAVDPVTLRPCGTILEAAKMKGMKVGLAVTSSLTDATPASFSSHSQERDEEYFIAQQQIEQDIDIMLGGGRNFYANRPDGRNLFQEAEQKYEYSVLSNYSQFSAFDFTHHSSKSAKVLGSFAPDHMDYEIDRNATEQPSLAQMARAALEWLHSAQSEEGFFLMIEGSRIDMAAHNNDPIGHYKDILAYNDAIQAVLDFLKENSLEKDTLVMSTSDHETGGLALGSNLYERTYPEYAWYPDRVLSLKMSTEKMTKEIQSKGLDPVEVLREMGGLLPLENITAEEEQWISSSISSSQLAAVLGDIVSYRARLSWGTWGHTSVDVHLYGYGAGAEDVRKDWQNQELGGWLAKRFGLDMVGATQKVQDRPVMPNTTSTRSIRRDYRYGYHD